SALEEHVSRRVPISAIAKRDTICDGVDREAVSRRRTSGGKTPPIATVGTPFLHGGSVPRAPWQRRRTTDSPRPGGGRQWAGRLRRIGSLARQVLFAGRVGRRGDGNIVGATSLFIPPPGE